jgi:hypothetical protein
MIKNLPKGHHIIFVTPYNGSKSGSKAVSLVQLRKYELEMAKKYDFVTVADWYQVAKENISIWNVQMGFTLAPIVTLLTVGLNYIPIRLKRLSRKQIRNLLRVVKNNKKKKIRVVFFFCGQILTQFFVLC